MVNEIHKYENLFEDHIEIAKKKFIEKNGREPSLNELILEFKDLIDYFYD